MIPRTLLCLGILLLSSPLLLAFQLKRSFMTSLRGSSNNDRHHDRHHHHRRSSFGTSVGFHAHHPMTKTPTIEITSHVDWMELLHGHEEEDRLTVVLFKASFCKSCLRFERDWRQKIVPEAAAATDHRRQLDLATVEFTKNRALFKELDVQGLPTVHFYHRGELLTGYSCPPKEFSRVMESLNHYLNATPIELEFESNMEEKRMSFHQQVEVPSQERPTRTIMA